MLINTTVVRIMKKHGVLEHSKLVQEVTLMLVNQFKPDASQIQVRSQEKVFTIAYKI